MRRLSTYGLLHHPSFSPVRGHRRGVEASPASTANNAFWQSVSLDLEGLPLSGSDGGFPESDSSEILFDIGKALLMRPIQTPQLPRVVMTTMATMAPPMQQELLFADGDGNLWSAGLPKQEREQQQPSVIKGLDVDGVRNPPTAPSPKDPRAKFPSFSTAFGVVQMIRPPARARLLA